MWGLREDLGQAFRRLFRTPAYTFLAVLLFALGIGANAAIFGLLHAVILRPLPFENPEQLVMVFETYEPRGRLKNVINPGNLMRWQERAESFESLAGYSIWSMNVTGRGDPDRLPTGLATRGFFSTLGVQPLIGRGFESLDFTAESDDVMLLGYGYWQQRFGGDPGVIGSELRINDQPAVIVGVLPAWFEVPPPNFETVARPSIWVPLALTENTYNATGRWMLSIGRLKAGVGLDESQSEMDLIARGIEGERPDHNKGWGVNVVELREHMLGHVQLPLTLLAVAVTLILLLACANVANLVMIRGARSRRDYAIRSALGAGRWQLFRLPLIESIIVSLLGGVFAFLVALWGISGLPAFFAESLPRLDESASFGGATLLASFVLALALGLIFGVLSAVYTNRGNVVGMLYSGRGQSRTRTERKTSRILVLAEVAIALTLLVGAGLLLQSLNRLLTEDPGFQTENLVTFQLSLPSSQYPTDQNELQFFGELVRDLGSLPGVESATAVSWLPLSGQGSATSFQIEGQPVRENQPAAEVRVVQDNFFETLKIQVLKGRSFSSADTAESRKVVVINESMAQEFWPGEEALGKKVLMNWGEVIPAQVVGIVPDVKLRAPDSPSRSTLYWHQSQLPNNFMSILIRTSQGKDIMPLVRAEVREKNDQLPVASVATMDEVISESVKDRRAVAVLLMLFAGLALVLAVVGLYGVISYSVVQRSREIGIRMALGADRSKVLRKVVGEGLWLAVMGTGLGLLACLLFNRFMESLLYEVSPIHLPTLAAGAVILLVLAVTASYIPARRAASVSPVESIRYE